MRFDGSGTFLAGQSDVDPVAAPNTILSGHFLSPGSKSVKNPTKLHLLLAGVGSETLTVNLYYLVEDKSKSATVTDYTAATTRWVLFATAEVLTNNTVAQITTDIPAGGAIYMRRTGDTIASEQTRQVLFAWS